MQRMMIFLFLLLFIPVSGWAEVNWFLKRFPDFDACEGCVENCTEADIKRYCRVDLNSNSYTDEEYKSLIQEMINKDGRIFDFRIRNVITMLYRHVYEHPEDKRFNELKEYLYEKDVLIGLWRLDGIIQYIPDSLSYYREVIKNVLSMSGGNDFEFFPANIRDDTELAIYALKISRPTYQYMSDRLKKDKRIALVAVRRSFNGDLIKYVPAPLNKDKDILLAKKEAEFSYKNWDARNTAKIEADRNIDKEIFSKLEQELNIKGTPDAK